MCARIDAAALHARDNKRRIKLRWSPFAFIAPKLPKRVAGKAGKYALAVLAEKLPRAYAVHIYDIAQLIEEAWLAGARSNASGAVTKLYENAGR